MWLVRSWRLVAAALALSFPSSIAEARVITQSPCAGDALGICLTVTSDSNDPSLRAIDVVARERGHIVATFHGAMYCASQVNGMRVVDLATQIVTDGSDARATAPGGLRHVAIFYNAEEGVSFNLSSTRAIPNPTKSRRRLTFKLNKSRLDAGVVCYLYNLTFTVDIPD